jgi:hypothetical protein
MKQIIQLLVPESWADVKLKDYLALHNELKSYEGDEEAQTAVTLFHLCGLNADDLQKISNKSYLALKEDIVKFISSTEHQLQQHITINGVEYGFEPNLSQISYGAFVDITKYDTITIDDNWANIMSILYRPIETKSKHWYSIQPYDGKIEKDKWLNVGMDIHFGALFFFVHLLTDLQSSILSSMSKEKGLPHNIKSILEKSGEIIHQSLN